MTHPETNEFGYSPEYWDLLPDETKDGIVAEQATFDEFDDYADRDVDESQVDPFERREYLEETLGSITDANKGRGVRVMTSAHPRFTEIDARYDIDRVRSSSMRSEREAAKKLALACGECAIAGCGMRNNFPAFDEKYHFKKSRSDFAKKLGQDPTTPC